MIQKIKIKLLSLSILSLLAVPVLAPVTVLAVTNPDISNSTCTGANNLAISSNAGVQCTNLDSGAQNGTSRVNEIIAQVINIMSVIVGAIAVVMIIIGGFRYVTSGGDSAKITSAKNTILYALIGLIIVALSQIVVKFVLTKATTG